MAKEIEVIIETDGTMSLDLVGWRGKGCSDVVDEMCKALGKKIKSDKKCEYWQQETETKIKQKVKR